MTYRYWRSCGSRRGMGLPEALLAMQFGGWNSDFGDWGTRGRRRRRRRMFDSGELRLVLLKLIEQEPRHGYDLIRAIEDMTDGQYVPSAGVIYPTLSLLEDSSLIEALESDGARKAFAITDEGRAELEQKTEEVDALMARLSRHGESARRGDSASVKRAMGNLFAVLGHRLSEKGIDEALVREVTDILDEAAQRIERL
ncbi:PadR family transcriptional regulator [Parasphingopyxis algicola]|uniref:PadR family transcriptional regulator n=1 Tax=Parasphingopyxis algicola TaxID=2026624 RepID=UPI001FE437D9|nr:PadR family transcriptional regulator [Parasphingopyxis algicola]